MTNIPGGQELGVPSGPPGVWEIWKAFFKKVLESVIATVKKLLALATGNLIATIVLSVILVTLLVVLSQCGGPSNDSAATTTEVSTTVVATMEPSTTLAPETTVEETTTTSMTPLSVVPSGSVVQAPPTTEEKVATTTPKKKTTTTPAPTTTEPPTTTAAPTTTVAPTTTPAPTTTTLPPTTTTTTPPREVTFDFLGTSWYHSLDKTETITNITSIVGLGEDDWVGTLPGGTSDFAFTFYLHKHTYNRYSDPNSRLPTTYAVTNATCTETLSSQSATNGSVWTASYRMPAPSDESKRVSCTATGSGPITVAISPPDV